MRVARSNEAADDSRDLVQHIGVQDEDPVGIVAHACVTQNRSESHNTIDSRKMWMCCSVCRCHRLRPPTTVHQRTSVTHGPSHRSSVGLFKPAAIDAASIGQAMDRKGSETTYQ